MVFCGAIFKYVMTQSQFVGVPTPTMTLCRLIAGILMQMIINQEVKNGLQKMKYSVNHYWKFKYEGLAYTSGLL